MNRKKAKDRVLLLLLFKMICPLLLGLCTSAQAHVSSQVVKINIDLQDVTLNDFFTELSKQSNYDFLYNHNLIAKRKRINLVAKDKELSLLLDEVLPSLGLEYVLKDNVVIVRERDQDQEIVAIKGRVVDESSNPLPGVTVLISKSKIGTVTDRAGNYLLPLPSKEEFTLVFSFIGMKSQSIKYTGQDSINVVMKEDFSLLEEVIVSTGYERIDLRTTTSAIQSIRAEDVVIPGLTSIDQMLEGHIPGMIFMQNSGQVGASPRLRIRGTSTVLGSREPLWVIDGIVQENPIDIDPEQINDLDFVNLLGNAITGLNPDDIAQIDILKDASATALYGARAANGVIVVTTKQGKQGPPSLSYSFSGTFSRRPHYSDASVNMMNSKERIDYSRELVEKRIVYPTIKEWIGYEKPLKEYWLGQISFEEMQEEVGYYESINTDWFDVLMRNSLSHNHTVSLSGGSSALRYYVSAGFADTRGNIRGEVNKRYTGSVNLITTFDRLSIRFNFSGNVGNRKYTPNDVGVTKYAYETTRALPAFFEDGSLWYYQRHDAAARQYYDFNIIHEKENSSQDIRSSGLRVNTSLDYKISNGLSASLTASYSVDNTTQEVWHGENTYYASRLRYKLDQDNELPLGGEMIYKNTERHAYMVRAQANFNRLFGESLIHRISASAGGEISSNQYYGLEKTFRGYLKSRGKKMAGVNLSNYPAFQKWMGSNPQALGLWTDKLTNVASAYATLSYIYSEKYTFNANMRLDASNRFGSRANEKLSPIWSLSARWDLRKDFLEEIDWIDALSLRGSFGYQGNMLDSESPKLLIERGGIAADFEEFESFVVRFPNPDLKWEKTASYNTSLDFSFFRGRVGGSLSYFYKKTKDAFLTKTVSSVNGLSSWVVNLGTLENHGVELGLRLTLIDTRSRDSKGFRWVMTPNFGQIMNKLVGRSKDKTLTNEVTYQGFLNGTLEIEGRPLNSFYSYRYQGLSGVNGVPMFYGAERYQNVGSEELDLLEMYQQMELPEIFKDAMEYSGTRVPKVQGGVQHSLTWRDFSMSMNLAYSFGSKIRLLQMYPKGGNITGSIAPHPTSNVRKEFLDRWRMPGDELTTDVPGIVSSQEYDDTRGSWMWWSGKLNHRGEYIAFADSLWDMYDKSNFRTVNGSFVKIQSLSLRYNIPDYICKQLRLSSLYIGVSGTNLHTFCSKRLKGQDPATQDGTAPTINLSLRPTYSFNLNVSF